MNNINNIEVIDGYKVAVVVKGIKLNNVLKVTISGDDVKVDTEYIMSGYFMGGDSLGIASRHYNKDDVQIVRRDNNELYC